MRLLIVNGGEIVAELPTSDIGYAYDISSTLLIANPSWLSGTTPQMYPKDEELPSWFTSRYYHWNGIAFELVTETTPQR